MMNGQVHEQNVTTSGDEGASLSISLVMKSLSPGGVIWQGRFSEEAEDAF